MVVTAQKPDVEPRKLTILGSTGSIGCNTLNLVRRNAHAYQIEALTAFGNVAALAAQAREFGAALAVVADPACYGDLKDALSGSGIEPAAGKAALNEAADRSADWVMAGIVGAAGLAPTLTAVRRGAVIALANKECLVCAGDLMLQEVERSGATLLPVDSEHNAIFQVFEFDRADAVDRITLTASGGPFRNTDLSQMAHVTPAQAIAHPNWEMGPKISVDSATMMNKGLECIEAFYLFPVQADQIEVLIHPQSVVHSMVSYIDGSTLAQLGAPDMRTPIAYALSWPERMAAPSPRLDLAEIGQLTFEAPDDQRFPALELAREALRSSGVAPTVLNAANEIAVHAFLACRIGFLDIARVVEQALQDFGACRIGSLEDVFAADAEARRLTGRLVDGVAARSA